MKHLRSILTSIIAIVMAFTMSGIALADVDNGAASDNPSSGHTITLDESDRHTYRIFQVLTGTLSEEGSKNLGNPAWGHDVIENPGKVEDFITDLKKDNDEERIAKLVASKVDLEGDGQGTVGPGNDPSTRSRSGFKTGYYVLVDETELKAYGGDPKKIDTYARHVVQVVNDIPKLKIKYGTTESTKEISTDTLGDSDDEVNTINADTDNVSIGDTVNYTITATIPINADMYNYFYFIINDTIDPGLTLNNDYLVKIGDQTLQKDTDYSLRTGDDANPYSFQIALKNARAYKGQKVIVTYSAVLNQSAQIGTVPNKNTSNVTYSNNPNNQYAGTTTGFPAEIVTEVFGETPEMVTETYTTGIVIQKLDGDKNKLTGATFEIRGNSIEKVLTVEEEFKEDNANGDYYKLNNGTYTKTAPITEDSMIAAEVGATEGYVIDATYNGDDKVEIGGTTYRPYSPASDENANVFVLKKATASQYANISTKYKRITNAVLKDEITDHAIALPVDNDGIVRFVGLGAGEYEITETVTPAGYNTAEKLKVTISFDAKTKTWSSNSDKFKFADNVFGVEIENRKGTELPSTGGIGTTIFYIVGGVMVAGAVVFLLTKRRMSGNE